MLLGKFIAVALGVGLIAWLLFAEIGRVHYGRVTLLKGERLAIDGQPLVLWGVRLPNVEAKCRSKTGTWPCGAFATAAVLVRVSNARVMCFEQGDAHEGVQKAKCYTTSNFVSWNDLARELIRDGWAMPDLRVTRSYLQVAADAEKAGSGLWRELPPSTGLANPSTPLQMD